MPIIPAMPFILFLCLFYIAWGSEVLYAVYTFLIWLLVVVLQMICNKIGERLKEKESILSDQRMKLVNDLVTGIRTIKSYAWENHYLKKIRLLRN